MRFLTLSFQNIGPYQQTQTFDLQRQGVVSIIGKNGQGKSWILDALLWTAFGETGPRRESLKTSSGLRSDDVINEVVGRDALGYLDFESDGEVYRITRWRACKSFHTNNGVKVARVVDGDLVDVEDLDKGNVQTRIDELLGLDYALATRVLLRSQEDAFNFAQATPKERFEILTEIEGVGVLDERERVARDKASALVKRAEVLDRDINGKRQAIDVYRAEDLDAQTRDWEIQRGRDLAFMEQQRQQASERLSVHVEAAKSLPAHESRIAEIDAQIAALVPQPPEGLEGWQAHLVDLRASLAAEEASHAHAADRLDRLLVNGAGTCSLCGQGLSDDHFEGHRSSLESDTGRHQSSVLALRKSVAEAETTIAQAQQQAQSYAQEIQKQREALASERATLAAKINQIRANTAAIERERSNIESMLADEQAKQSEVNPWLSRAQEIEARCAELQTDIDQMQADKDSIGVQAQLLSWWIRHIPSLKSWIFDSVVGEITAEANRWLSCLMGGRCWISVESTATTKSGQTRDKIGLRCFEWLPDGSYVERPFKKWSGGEKRRISLAVDWALNARMAQRSRSSCSFVALDEVDRALDAEGREALLAAIEQMKEEKETVLIISHDVELQAAPDTKWIVTKGAKGSTVEVKRA